MKKIIFYLKTFWPMFSARQMVPWRRARDISELNIDDLKKEGVEGIAFDVDNTLTNHHAPEVHGRVAAAFKALQKEFHCIIYSNCERERYEELTRMFTLPVVEPGLKKPGAAGFQRALGLLALPPEKCLMVGDRALTDIVGGNRAGMKTVLVDIFEGPEPAVLSRIRKLERWRLKLKGIK